MTSQWRHTESTSPLSSVRHSLTQYDATITSDWNEMSLYAQHYVICTMHWQLSHYHCHYVDLQLHKNMAVYIWP